MVTTTRIGRTSGSKRAKPNPPNTTTTATNNNNNNNNNDDQVDRLSTLPDELLVSILTLLPTKTAISTSVLSHRWEHLWTDITYLCFTGPPTPTTASQNQKLNDFITSVNHILNRLTSPKILTFHLELNLPINSTNTESERYNSVVNSWVRQVCSRKPEDISVILNSNDSNYSIVIPAACIFQYCDTIVSLQMGRQCLFYDLPTNELNEFEINLPNLKKLVLTVHSLNWKESKHNLFKRLFKSCPLLEELLLMVSFSKEGYVDVVEIVCPNLKTLSLRANAQEVNVEVLISAPKLETLSVVSYRTGFRIVEKLCRLEKVDLAMLDPRVPFLGYITQALKAISSVRFLDLHCWTMGEVCRWETNCLQGIVFQNVTKLRITGFNFTKLCYLSVLLKYCPNLEVLVLMMGRDHGDS